ncbi:M1 family metallopeptidase [Sciscionella sediminilitoris]|uniref:M1 family metallopeptidase n=1 Tax=Sciscionella sediminilitoris TaxID=1445613 RepID=UPI00068A19C5|nr:M1 family metallopeptidase [Sciscionella sp. SE31]
MFKAGRAAATTIGAVCAVALFAGNAAAAGSPGGSSIGDSYYPNDGNTGYDVGHYDLRLNYQPKGDQLAGTATILLTPTTDLSSFSLDFGLQTDSVLVDNAKAEFAKKDAKLRITPKTDLPKGKQVTVVVRYHGVPSQVSINGEKDWVAGPDGALAAQEPHMAAFWYPVNDHPRDKASYDISVAVPKGLQAISNGDLVGESNPTADTTRYSWRQPKPQAPYLTLLAIGKYEIDKGKTPGGLPFITAYQKTLGDSLNAAKASVQRTPEVLDFEARNFGKYPFEAQGGVVSSQLSFSLETQTRPIYGAKNFAKGTNLGLIAHENAHQWFGDSTSVHDWRNIWLNEGFATYASWLWSEHSGEGTTQQLMDSLYAETPAGDKKWDILPGNPGPDNQFDSFAVYDRSAMAVQALRNVVGDKAFFAILHAWTAKLRYSTGTIPQFTALAEQISGKPVKRLLDTWLFTAGKPAHTAQNGFPATQRVSTQAPKSLPQIERNNRLLASQHH